METFALNKKPLIIAGVIMGIGLGGFFDGILFHQLLQIHSMLSAKYPPNTVRNLEINMFWDGLFHTLTYTMTLLGLGLLWRASKKPNVPWSGKMFIGALFTGWGLFNFCEGIIDHHILNVHHVVEKHGVSFFDYAFLASGVLFFLFGQTLIRAGARNATPRISL